MSQDPYLPPGVTDRDIDEAYGFDAGAVECRDCGHPLSEHEERGTMRCFVEECDCLHFNHPEFDYEFEPDWEGF